MNIVVNYDIIEIFLLKFITIMATIMIIIVIFIISIPMLLKLSGIDSSFYGYTCAVGSVVPVFMNFAMGHLTARFGIMIGNFILIFVYFLIPASIESSKMSRNSVNNYPLP